MQSDNTIKLYESARAAIIELRKERDRALERCLNAHAYIKELQRRIGSQHRHIEELERQLEHAQPGSPAEVREFLQSTEEGQ